MINTSGAQPGEYWSNRKANNKQFKNYGLKVHKPSKWTYFKFELKRFYCGVKKPKSGYKRFGKRWHKHCNPKAELEAMESQGITSDHIYWLGHATMLLSAEGVNILLDPIFSERASPVRFAGPKRMYPAATTIEELPSINVVLLSHNHYDHLDSRSVRKLYKRFPEILFVAPLGMETFLLPWGVPEKQIITLDWWEQISIMDVTVACTPSQHWSLHGLFDRNEALWCGWMIGWNSGGKKNKSTECFDWKKATTFYFTGDTAFNDTMFEQIHWHYPRIDVAALPIGAYSPRNILYTEHVDPESAVEIFKILHVKKAFGVHWGTFELSAEALDEPPEVLRRALELQHISTADFMLMRTGDFYTFPDAFSDSSESLSTTSDDAIPL